MKQFFKLKTWIITVFIIAIAIAVSAVIVFYKYRDNFGIAQAGSDDNVSGFAWSENIGWISFNSTDCVNVICRDVSTKKVLDYSCDDSPFSECETNGEECADWCQVCDNDATILCDGSGDCAGGACISNNYGVNIDSATGNFSGYTWSGNIGWIDFAPSGPYPNNPNHGAKYEYSDAGYNKRVTGWAKILSLGDDGWLKMSDDSVADWNGKGVKINIATSDFSGWAWNGNDDGAGIGWVSFNCADAGAGGCAGHNYKVVGNVNTPPTAINLSAPNWNYNQACSLYARQAFLRWEFDDLDQESEQSAYQVIFDNNNDPAEPNLINTGKTPGSASQYSVGSDQLSYNTPYYWWVKVWDNHDVASDLTQYDTEPDTDNNDGAEYTFTAYLHEFPDVDFSWFAQNPSKGEEVQFTDSSKVYLSAAPS
ncbi:MAG: hypothetical protein U9R14_02020, partial [Patescibacteria group bacterium]|nr:hypothetical protein [Patescibacteria group bacterium]